MNDDLVKRLRFFGPPIEKEAADRIEELEAANKRLNEQMDAIEEMGTESLNALPDCLMRLAPALVENDELKTKLAEAVEKFVSLEKAASEVARRGAETGPQWTKLTIALLAARITLAELKGEKDE